jgi:hypothetical protein
MTTITRQEINNKHDLLVKMLMYFKGNGINHDPAEGLEKVLAYQDLVGNMGKYMLKSIYERLSEDEKQLFMWANSCCLSCAMTVDVLQNTIVDELFMNRLEFHNHVLLEAESKVQKKINTYNQCKTWIFKKIAKLREENAYLVKEVNHLNMQVSKLKETNKNLSNRIEYLREKASKLNIIREALKGE